MSGLAFYVKKTFKKRKTTFIGLLLVMFTIAGAVAAPVISPYAPDKMSVADRLQSPSSLHRLGTDDFGRDIFSRVLYGARVSLLVGAAIVSFTLIFGVLFGLAAGYYPGIDTIIMRIMDGLMAFPGIVLAIAMMGSLGPSVNNVIIALGIVYTPRVARLVRSVVLTVRENQYIEAAKALGADDVRIITRHILPNCLSPIVVQASFIFSYAILGEAALSFLGVGVPATTPSWGNILSDGRIYIRNAPWITVFPGLSIMLIVLGLNMVGDGLRDLLDPKLKKI